MLGKKYATLTLLILVNQLCYAAVIDRQDKLLYPREDNILVFGRWVRQTFVLDTQYVLINGLSLVQQ